MDYQDTSIGGDRRHFPTTIWTNILEAANPASPENRGQLERLLRDYWKPVYLHIRMNWKKSVEDAKDLTQAFFSHVLQKEFLSRVRPNLGTFRSYLKRSVHNFVIDADRMAAVRSPSGPMFSLDAEPGELERLVPASPQETADEAYDREWFDCLFESSLDELESRLKRADKEVYFVAFRMFCLDPANTENPVPETSTYREIAARLTVKETDVRNYLSHCRRMLQDILRERIREYALTDDELERELRQAMKI